MKLIYKKNKGQSLLIFFCGWAMDERPFKKLISHEYDVLFVYNYDSIDISINVDKDYDDIVVIAWSFGVWVYSMIARSLDIDISFAISINGTPLPIDDRYGIKSSIFYNTLNNINEETINRFYKNMFSKREDYILFSKQRPERSIESQQRELIVLERLFNKYGNGDSSVFDASIIGKRDLMFRAKKQLAYWQDRIKTILVDSGHFLFYMYNSWDDIIKTCRG